MRKIVCILISFMATIHIYAENYVMGFLSNEHFAPIVKEMESTLTALENVKNAVVYDAADPWFFVPDLFDVEVTLENGDVLDLCSVPRSLEFYEDSTGIYSYNHRSFLYVVKRQRKKGNTSARIPFNYLTAYMKKGYKSIIDMLNDIDEIKKQLFSFSDYSYGKEMQNVLYLKKETVYFYTFPEEGIKLNDNGRLPHP